MYELRGQMEEIQSVVTTDLDVIKAQLVQIISGMAIHGTRME